MKPLLRNLLGLGAVAVLAVFFVMVLSVTRSSRTLLQCSRVAVEIADSSRMSFVTRADVEEYLKGYGPCIGERLDSIDLRRIEELLAHKSAVLGSEAWLTDDGTLHIRITQREPAVRLQVGGNGFFADEEGFLFPLSRYGSKVPVVDGAVPLRLEEGFKGEPESDEEKAWLREILALARYISRHAPWTDNIAQITVLSDGDLVLIPRTGRERFIFGPPRQVEEKFAKIRDYYEYIAPSKEEGWYRSVNVKYRGQIVCRQK